MLLWFGWGTQTFYKLKLKRGLRRIQYLTQITRLVNTKGFRWRPTQIKVTGTKQYNSPRRRGRRYWWAAAPWAASAPSPRQSGWSRPGPVCPPRLQSLSSGEPQDRIFFIFFYPALRTFSSLEKIWFEKTPPTLFSFLWNLHVLSFIFNFKYCFYPVVPIKSDPYICKSCRLMAQTGSGWWFSFPVRTEIIPQFVCLKTAPRPPRQQLPRSRSMTTSMMFTGLCRAYFLLLTLSYIASTLPCCMSHY